jgi:hypothetical protein
LLVESGGVYTVQGVADAIFDPEPPISLTVTVGSGATATTFSGSAAANGSFAIEITGSSGDPVSLTATDGHPEPRSTTVSVGSMPGNDPPVINGEILTSYEEPGIYYVTVPEGAIVDPDDPVTIRIIHLISGEIVTDTILSGAYYKKALCSECGFSSGDQIEVTATDSHPLSPLSTTVTLELPPANYGPPVVHTGLIRLEPMALGYQLLGDSGWADDADWPLTVTVIAAGDPGWQSAPVTVAAGEPLYSIIVGNPGDSVSIIVEDGSSEYPMATDPVSVGILPALGIVQEEAELGGHTISMFREDQVAILDGGTVASWTSGGQLWEPYYLGLSAATDIINLDSLRDEVVVLDGGNVYSWWSHSSEGVWYNDPIDPLPISAGELTIMESYGDDLLMIAQETDGIRLYRARTLSLIGDPPTSFAPACDPIDSFLLPNTQGMTALAMIPAPSGEIGVLVNDAGAELRMIDANDPQVMLDAGAYDMPLSALTWAEPAGADIFIGRADGGLELWQWTVFGLEMLTSWAPDSGAVTCATRVGEHLWLGLNDGSVVQIAIRNPASPIAVGSLQLGHPIRDIERSGTDLNVAATEPDNSAGRWVILRTEGLVS